VQQQRDLFQNDRQRLRDPSVESIEIQVVSRNYDGFAKLQGRGVKFRETIKIQKMSSSVAFETVISVFETSFLGLRNHRFFSHKMVEIKKKRVERVFETKKTVVEWVFETKKKASH
jgi:hypothetical protein